MSRRRFLVICFVSVFRFCLTLFPFAQAESFGPPLKPSLSLHTLALGEGALVVRVAARTSPSLKVRSLMTFTIVSSTTPKQKKKLLLKDKHGD